MRLVAILVVSLALAATATAQQYTVQVLAPPADMPANATTWAYALNNRGQVFGVVLGTNKDLPMLWTDGVPVHLPVPDGYYFARGGEGTKFLTDSGMIVANVTSVSNPTYQDIAVWTGGAPSVLPQVPAEQMRGCSETGGRSVLGVNSAGHVLGRSRGNENNVAGVTCYRYWIYKDGVFEVLPDFIPSGIPGANCSSDLFPADEYLWEFSLFEGGSVNYLNNADHVLVDAFKRCRFTKTSAGAGIVAGSTFTLVGGAPTQINNHDQVLGYTTPGGVVHVTLWTAGSTVDLGAGGWDSMNNLGDVVVRNGLDVTLHTNGAAISVPEVSAILAAGNGTSRTILLNDARQIVVTPQFGLPRLLTPVGSSIADVTPPEIVNIPSNQNLSAPTTAGAVATWSAPTADDDRDGPVPVQCSPPSGATFPIGTTTVTCTATDFSGNIRSASFIVTVTGAVAAVNHAPAASSVVVTTQEGTAKPGMLQATDIDGDALAFSIVTPPTKGTLTISNASTGAFTYTPNAGAIGYDTFAFGVADTSGASSTATGIVFIVATSPQWPGQIVRASVGSHGEQADSQAQQPAVSPDGRYVAFYSPSALFVAGDTNGTYDVFVHDRKTGLTERVSVASDGTQGNAGSFTPSFSADGRYVVFDADASNLVAGDTNGAADVFVHDRQTGLTERVSLAIDGAQGNAASFNASVSADGRYVSFVSFASNLVPGDTNGVADVFVRDRLTGETRRVSVASDGAQANDGSDASVISVISADGGHVVFLSAATNLVAGDTNGMTDVFEHDLATGQTVRVSVASGGTQANNNSTLHLSVSADGRYVAFSSLASNLAPGDTNGTSDAFMHDRQTGQTVLVSVADGGAPGNGSSTDPMLSADGRYVAFVSSASNLVPGDVNGMADLFVRDRQTGQTTLVSIANDGTQGNDRSSAQPSFSADGRYVAFSSRASNLVPDDTNGAPDVFVAGGVSVDPLAIDIPGGGAQRSVSVSFEYPGTPWTATTTAPWITIAPPAGGSADGIVNFSVAPNTGSARTGTIVAALHTVNVTQAVAAPPVASDGFLTTPEDTPISGTLVATNPNGDPITFAIVTPPARGMIVLTNASTGSFTYTPALNRFGGDSFTFQATDGGQSSNVATVTITVNPVNDAPVATDATLEAVEDTAATGQLIAGDPDSLVVTFVIVTPPAHGSVAIPSPTTSPLGGSYVYTPVPNYHGPDSFTYRVLDGALQSNIATVTIAVAAVNDAPVASSAVVTTQEGVAKTGTLQATDVDGDVLTFSIVTPPAKGTLTISDASTGAFTYTPNASGVGYDTFTFSAADTGGASSTATGMVFIVAASPRWPGQTVRASVSSGGGQGNGESIGLPSLSADGRYMAFQYGGANLVAGDTNGSMDVFVHDRQTGQTTRVSVASGGGQSNDDSYWPAISADGRYVAFASLASNLVAGDTNGSIDVFVHDRQTGQTTRVSVASGGGQSNDDSYSPVISADGRYVAFASLASNLVTGDTNAANDVFVHDRQTGQTTRVSVASDGTQPNGASDSAAVSADGRYVVFSSTASNLVQADTNGAPDVFVHDRQTGRTTRVSVANDGTQANSESVLPAVSADGRYVTFSSNASNLVPGDTNGVYDVFVHHLQTGQTTRVSVASDGTQANADSFWSAVNADGRYVAFSSRGSNLVPGDTNASSDVFVHDLLTGQTTLVSVSDGGAQGNANFTDFPRLSADARYVAFLSLSSNLVPNDTNNATDVFVGGGVTVTPTTITVPGAGGTRSIDVSFEYPGTAWTATATAAWITINPPAGGSANGTVTFTVAPNTGPARAATLVAALQTITITQDAFVDTTPPTVTTPAPVTVYATQPAGATAGAVPAIAAFLAGATAVDDSGATVQQAPLLNGVSITGATVFAIGANTVTFSFRDAAGHVGFATSLVTVLAGRPAVSVGIVGTIAATSNQAALLRVTNSGAGNALNVNVALSSTRTLTGTGTVTLDSGLPSTIPLLAPGQSADIPIVVTMPPAVQRFALSEAVTMNDYAGAALSSSATQTIIPKDVTPPTITVGPVIAVTSTSMTITWTTSEPATSRFDWGVGTSVNRVVPDDSVLATSHSKTITGLLPNTQYSVIVSGHDAAGNNYMSSRRETKTNP